MCPASGRFVLAIRGVCANL